MGHCFVRGGFDLGDDLGIYLDDAICVLVDHRQLSWVALTLTHREGGEAGRGTERVKRSA